MSKIETNFVDPVDLTPAVYIKKDGVAFLFDCGRAEYPPKLTNRLKHIFISHAHVDHLTGFDDLLVMQLMSTDSHIHVYGPEGITTRIMHKVNSYTWNLVGPNDIEIDVFEIRENELHQTAFSVNGNMSGKKVEIRAIHDDIILAGPDYTVKRIILNHGIISVGYAFEETHTFNIQKEKLAQSGFQGGPWIQSLKEAVERGVYTEIEIDGSMVHTSELAYMIEANPGIKIVFVTDFLWDEDTQSRLPEFAKHADILYCEAAYKDEDIELAQKNFHMTDSHAEELGRLAAAKNLVNFHRSERYGE